MKKHLVTLLVFIYIAAFLLPSLTGVVTLAEELPETGTIENTTLPQTEPSAEEGISALLEHEIQEPQWLSYSDFILAQNQRAMEDPALFVGALAQVNPIWDSLFVSADPSQGYEPLSASLLADTKGNYLIKVVDYAISNGSWVWYKVEAAEGYVLPQELVDNPYILHLDSTSVAPTLLWLPQEAMFLGESVTIKRQPVVATKEATLPTAELPAVFSLNHESFGWGDDPYNWIPALTQDYYNLGDVTGWHGDLPADYLYVEAGSVLLIFPEVTLAVEKLKNADSLAEFNAQWDSLSDSVKALLLPHHMEQLESCFTQLQNVRHETTVMVGGIAVPVSVSGAIPKTGVTLTAAAVSAEQVLEEGFDIQEDASDLITALDIKLLKTDGTEWQPEDGERVEVSIGVGALGIEDETVVRLHHKHEEEIYVFEIFLVLDGKVTVRTTGFSAYAVSAINTTNKPGDVVYTNNTTTPIELTVGQTIILYNEIPSDLNNNRVGTWEVTDTSGALFYTVHSTDEPNYSGGMYVPWIKIIALKEATDVTLTFKSANITYNNNNQGQAINHYTEQTYTVNVVPPKAADGRALYLKDDVNATGRIIATLVDENGDEIPNGLDGAVFKWTRSDKMLITPHSYGDNYRSVNIAKDHTGLVEARKTGNMYNPITYTVVATLSDGTTETATYKVLYQSEFLNATFEAPHLTQGNYTYYPNGWEGMYWKTTAPGTNLNLIRDIEFGAVNGSNTTDFGVPQAADASDGGTQFAELNAEEFGALYQDIISVPGEEIEWSFRHAPRRKQSWTSGTTANKMYIVLGATEYAQELLTQTQLEQLGAAAKEAALAKGNEFNNQWLNCQVPIDVTYQGGAYYVWYHDAGAPPVNDTTFYTAEKSYGWTLLSGSYVVPQGQYRTRLFFATDSTDNDHQNFGNLVDSTRAGQYKTYLIEYYEETFEAGDSTSTLVHKNEHDESGEALVYSSVLLDQLDHFLRDEHDFLHTILINGSNYPYTLRYDKTQSDSNSGATDSNGNPILDDNEDAFMYVEKYPGTAQHYPVANTNPNDPDYYDPYYQPNDYSQYDIVMQITLRDTVVAVQKVIEFPTALTEEQKLKIINDLKTQNGVGYQAEFQLTAVDVTTNDKGELIPTGPISQQPEDRNGTVFVTQRDPKDGRYTGYISLGRDPSLGADPDVGQAYVVTETAISEIPGLELDQVTFDTTMYKYGATLTPVQNIYNESQFGSGPLQTTPFVMKSSAKIADIVVTNFYKEKLTRVHYEAVGKGKVQLLGTVGDVVVGDKPSELLAFYSGKANGAMAIAGEGAKFVGWYTDPACTEDTKVTAVNGVYNEDEKTFIPNTNIIEAEEVTFYAKFETGTIIINRTGGEAGETFVYLVTREYGGSSDSFYVTVTCDGNGSGSRTIHEVAAGNYTIEELGDWSWRHVPSSQSDSHNGLETKTFSFGSPVSKDSWLSGWSSLWKNIFKNNVKTAGG